MAPKDNGILVLKWMIGIVITGVFMLTTNVVANDKASRGRDTAIIANVSTVKSELTSGFYKSHTEIIQRLTRIETKVEQ